MQNITEEIRAIAIEEGQDVGDATVYGNYAIGVQEQARVYGGNIPRLTAIRERIDPTGVMALAGGFKF